MKKKIIFLCVCMLMADNMMLNAQTDDEVSNAFIIGAGALKIGLDLYEAGNRKESERKLNQWKESGDPRGDCYYIDNNGKLTQDMIDCYVGENKFHTTCTECLERQKKSTRTTCNKTETTRKAAANRTRNAREISGFRVAE